MKLCVSAGVSVHRRARRIEFAISSSRWRAQDSRITHQYGCAAL